MTLLLDTHCWLWLKLDPTRLPSPVRRRLSGNPVDLALSTVCVLEIAIKHAAGRLKLEGTPATLVDELTRRRSGRAADRVDPRVAGRTAPPAPPRSVRSTPHRASARRRAHRRQRGPACAGLQRPEDRRAEVTTTQASDSIDHNEPRRYPASPHLRYERWQPARPRRSPLSRTQPGRTLARFVPRSNDSPSAASWFCSLAVVRF